MSGRDALLATIALVVALASARNVARARRLRARLVPVVPARGVRSWWPGRRPPFRRPPLVAIGNRREARRTRAIDRDLPRLAESMARELRVGGSPAAALFAAGELLAGPVAADLDVVRRSVGSGRRLEMAIGDWAVRRPSPGVAHLVTVLALGIDLGGALAPALDATSEALRARLEVGDEVRALTAQARASAVLLTALPVVAVTGLAMVDPSTVGFLVGSTFGRCCLGLGAALSVAGWWWMGRLTGSGR